MCVFLKGTTFDLPLLQVFKFINSVNSWIYNIKGQLRGLRITSHLSCYAVVRHKEHKITCTLCITSVYHESIDTHSYHIMTATCCSNKVQVIFATSITTLSRHVLHSRDPCWFLQPHAQAISLFTVRTVNPGAFSGAPAAALNHSPEQRCVPVLRAEKDQIP